MGGPVLSAIFVFVSFYYLDISCTVDNSLLLLKSIAKGEFFHYYDFSISRARTVWAPNYELTVYVIFAIWCIPLLGIERIFGWDSLYSMPAILWVKLLLLLFLVGTVIVIYKICIEFGMTKERAQWTVFLFLTSINVMVPVLMISQVDIVNVFFIMLGIYMYMKGDMKKFTACFAFTIPIKMFGLFIFIPLLVLREKRLLKCIAYMAGALSNLVLLKLIFSQDEAYQFAIGSFAREMTANLQKTGLDLGIGTAPFFIAALGVICIWCYVKNCTEEEYKYLAVYVPLFVYTFLFTAFGFFPYWIVLLAPFVILSIMTTEKYLKINLLLNVLGSFCGFLVCAYQYYWVYSGGIMPYLLVGKLFPRTDLAKFGDLGQILRYYHLDRYIPAAMAVYAVCNFSILILNRPRKRNIGKVNEERVERGVVWVRLASLAGIVMMMLYMWVAELDPIQYDSTTGQAYAQMEESLLPEGSLVSQTITAERDYEMTELHVMFHNEANQHIDMSSVVCAIREEATGKEIFSRRIGTSMIDTDQTYRIDVGDVRIEKGKAYEISFSGMDDNGKYVGLMLTDEAVDRKHKVIVNGKQMDKNLYMLIRGKEAEE